jgi:hypothetical protein
LVTAWVGDHDEAADARQHRLQRLAQIFRVERGEALVEDHELRALEEGAGHEEAAALPVGQLPAALPHHLEHAGRHAVEEGAETELATQRLGFRHVLRGGRPAASHEDVERERFREHVVVVELRSQHHPAPPPRLAKGGAIEPVEQKQPGGRHAQARQEIREGGLSRAGAALDEKASPPSHGQIEAVQHQCGALRVAEGEVARFQEDVPAPGMDIDRPDNRLAGGRAKQRRHPPPGHAGVREVEQAVGQGQERAPPEQEGAQHRREEGAIAAAPEEERARPEHPEEEPAPRHQGLQTGRAPIHVGRGLHVGVEQAVLLDVPPRRLLLRDAGAVAHHALDEVVGERQAGIGPSDPTSEVARGEPARGPEPEKERGHLDAGDVQRGQDAQGDQELDQGRNGGQPAAQGERLDRFRLHDRPQHLAATAPPHLVRAQRQRAGQEPLLEQRAARQRQPALEPGGPEPERNEGDQEEGPGAQPRRVDASLQRAARNHPPGAHERHRGQQLQSDQFEQAGGDAGQRELPLEGSARGQPEQPAPAERDVPSPLAHEGRAHPATRRGVEHLATEKRVALLDEGRGEHVPQAREGNRDRAQGRRQHPDRGPRCANQRQPAWRGGAGHLEQGGPRAP